MSNYVMSDSERAFWASAEVAPLSDHSGIYPRERVRNLLRVARSTLFSLQVHPDAADPNSEFAGLCTELFDAMESMHPGSTNYLTGHALTPPQ